MEASAKMRLSRLRQAVRENRVSFPSPVPKFAHQYRADVQWRLAELYFVRGWSFCQLGGRYQVTAGRVRQTIRRWAEQAIALNYLQNIAAEDVGQPAAMATTKTKSEWSAVRVTDPLAQ
jgi:hypothetical protein